MTTKRANPAALEIVAEAASLRADAEVEFRRALVRAHEAGHAVRAIATPAQLHWTQVARLIRAESPENSQPREES